MSKQKPSKVIPMTNSSISQRRPPDYEETALDAVREEDSETETEDDVDEGNGKQSMAAAKLSTNAAAMADAFSNITNLRRYVAKWMDCVPSKRKIGIKKDGSGTIDVSMDRYVPVSG